jgi:hypothetical protein
LSPVIGRSNKNLDTFLEADQGIISLMPWVANSFIWGITLRAMGIGLMPNELID